MLEKKSDKIKKSFWWRPEIVRIFNDALPNRSSGSTWMAAAAFIFINLPPDIRERMVRLIEHEKYDEAKSALFQDYAAYRAADGAVADTRPRETPVTAIAKRRKSAG